MKIVAVIPSRYGSNRFVGKALALIKGKPMVRQVYEKISKLKNIDYVCVATDDIRIKNEVCNFDGNVIMTSPNHNSGTDRVAEAVNKIGLSNNDLVINVQGDQPLINNKSLRFLINPFFSNINFDMTTLAYPLYNYKIAKNPNDVKVVTNLKGFAIYFSRACIPYDRDNVKNHVIYKHLGIYAYKKKFLDIFSNLSVGNLEKIEMLEQLRPIEYGYRIFVVTSPYDSIEIDTTEDILKLEK